MKYHIVHHSRTPISFKEKPTNHCKDLHKLKLVTNFDVNLTSVSGGVMDKTLFVTTLWQ